MCHQYFAAKGRLKNLILGSIKFLSKFCIISIDNDTIEEVFLFVVKAFKEESSRMKKGTNPMRTAVSSLFTNLAVTVS